MTLLVVSLSHAIISTMNSDEEEIILPTMTAAEFEERILAANERLAAESEAIREQNKTLQELVLQYKRYLSRLETTLAELDTERERMDAEVRRLLSPEERAAFETLIAR
jgi:peptidoglycan hydrolase CwlO-like protein